MEHPAPAFETVSYIARQLEVCENTIRNWERDGLISAGRDTSGKRIFPVGTAKKLRRARLGAAP